MVWYFVLVFLVAFLTSLILTPLTIRLARRMNWLDMPAPRRLHQVPTPRIGGIPLGVAIVAALAVTIPFPRTDENELMRIMGLALGIVIVAIVGLIDDVRELKPLPLFAMQIGVAVIAIASGVVIFEISSPIDGTPIILPAALAIAFTIFWVVGMMNTVNFLDGLDGLVGGVTVIAGMVLFLHNFKLGQASLALPALALIGATLAFLIFNFPPARIFLGSGAYVLGFALAVLAIIGGTKAATVLMVLAIPILDVAWQILNRVRAGKSPFAADRGHLHMRLYDTGVSTRAIVLTYYALTALFGALALTLPSGIPKLVSLVLIGGVALVVLARLRR
ncbi:MAG: undecaprenyl/decaprenyl-phosphate alpha-N-acetylglucosaminyl 1-phosphate transferase [Anaerolineae bacterium]|nr:undecaprenyl/decaprenyl-phosphate alpha-N-acetylglucosaminyl 1-phosphate transferase [Anaerolineae bacterium]